MVVKYKISATNLQRLFNIPIFHSCHMPLFRYLDVPAWFKIHPAFSSTNSVSGRQAYVTNTWWPDLVRHQMSSAVMFYRPTAVAYIIAACLGGLRRGSLSDCPNPKNGAINCRQDIFVVDTLKWHSLRQYLVDATFTTLKLRRRPKNEENNF